MTQSEPVLILGAGINGAAVARDLALNGVAVWIVDRDDIASGATSKSSRLIHGGLRYLEYGEFRLVREALGERERLLRYAADFVTPLRFYVPVRSRFGGWRAAIMRLVGGKPRGTSDRGLWLVRLGMWMYDHFTRASSLPRRSVHRATDADVPRVDTTAFHWLCAYSDAQMMWPERYTIALLRDAAELAAEQNVEFRVLTYRDVAMNGRQALITDNLGNEEALHLQPSLIVNATGAWGDRTLKHLHMAEKRRFGGATRSPFVSTHPTLRGALRSRTLY